MKAAPIIHTRTFSCDFNSEFLVRPDRFMDCDIKWARKNVLGATGEIDGLQGVRWLIADNGKYRMAGVVGFLKNICSKCQLSEENKLKSEELFCDDKGRLVYAFIGIVVDKLNSTDYGMLSLDYLWNMYLDRIYPIWKRTYQEVIVENFVEVNLKATTNMIATESVMADSKEFFEANAAMDYELFSAILCDKNKSDFSFCSNILDFNMVKHSGFSTVTTSQNIITRIKRENAVKPSFVQNKQSSPIRSVTDNPEQSPKPETKKKSFAALMIGLMLFVIIMIMLLLIKKTDPGQSIGLQTSEAVEMIGQVQSEDPIVIMYIL